MNDLVVAITGAIQESNFDEYKIQLLESIKDKDHDLVTDADFVHAKDVVKACTDGEKAIKDSKALAVAGMADVNKLFAAMDEISAQLRETRLGLSKRIKSEQETQKQLAFQSAMQLVSDHIEAIDIDQFYIMAQGLSNAAHAAIMDSMKGRSSLKSIQEHTMDVAMDYLQKVNELEVLVLHNSGWLNARAEDNMALFVDKARLLVKDTDTFMEIVNTRMAAHEADLKAQELRRKDEERRRKEFEDAKQANENKANEAALGENLAVKPTVAPVKQAETYMISVLYNGDLNDASEAARMVRSLFDDDNNAIDIKLEKVK